MLCIRSIGPLNQCRSLHGGSLLRCLSTAEHIRESRDFIMQRQFEVTALSQVPIMFYLMTNNV